MGKVIKQERLHGGAKQKYTLRDIKKKWGLSSLRKEDHCIEWVYRKYYPDDQMFSGEQRASVHQEIYLWCEKTCSHEIYALLEYGGAVIKFYFQDPDDATLFRLRWG